MCIVLLTTAHPDYALIAIDNRDEYVLRPTSRPEWWTPPPADSISSGSQGSEELQSQTEQSKLNTVLSSRDLFRSERGTWLGITKTGVFAVLTNFREPVNEQTTAGVRSRGGMVNAWLGGLPEKEGSVMGGVQRLVDEGVRNVGGFSMVCGHLRRKAFQQEEGIAVVSNRADEARDVPVIAKRRGGVWGLSNAAYSEGEGEEWPKVKIGKSLLDDAVRVSTVQGEGKDELLKRLFGVLDEDTLPAMGDEVPLQDKLKRLRESVFIRRLGDEEEHRAKAAEMSATLAAENAVDDMDTMEALGKRAFDKGIYGTQRQTVVLVDWQGKVTFVERALWDDSGRDVKRGDGDVRVEFDIEGWDD